HTQAGAVQHSEGQHHDLACLPGARSRDSGHRGTAASWHGSGPPHRRARRVVSPAPDARTSFGVTRIRTESLPLAVSVSGKRNFGARKKPPKSTRLPVTAWSLRNEPSHRSPPIRGLW